MTAAAIAPPRISATIAAMVSPRSFLAIGEFMPYVALSLSARHLSRYKRRSGTFLVHSLSPYPLPGVSFNRGRLQKVRGRDPAYR